MIDSYHFGAMTVRGKVHRNDLKIIGDQIIGDWWRLEGHALHAEDIADILAAPVEVLVVGSGEPGRMEVTRAAAQALERRGRVPLRNSRYSMVYLSLPGRVGVPYPQGGSSLSATSPPPGEESGLREPLGVFILTQAGSHHD